MNMCPPPPPPNYRTGYWPGFPSTQIPALDRQIMENRGRHRLIHARRTINLIRREVCRNPLQARSKVIEGFLTCECNAMSYPED